MAKPGHPFAAVIRVNDRIHWSAKPLALFGGTFDPVHYGHLRCAHEARIKLGLEALFLLPAGTPVHRAPPQASNTQRLEMLRLAQTEFPGLEVDQRELNRKGPSYMVDSLQEIRTEWPHRPLLLLIGQDAANELNSWHRWLELFTLAHIVILTRPGSRASYQPELEKQICQRQVDDPESLTQLKAGCVLDLKVTAIDICATTIKSMFRLGRSPAAMLPQPVMAYIREQGLYMRDNSVT